MLDGRAQDLTGAATCPPNGAMMRFDVRLMRAQRAHRDEKDNKPETGWGLRRSASRPRKAELRAVERRVGEQSSSHRPSELAAERYAPERSV